MIKLCKKRHNRMKPKRRIQSLKQLIKESQEVASKLPYYNKGKLIDPKVLEITGILTTEKIDDLKKYMSKNLREDYEEWCI